MTLIQCLVFLESETGSTAVSGRRRARSKRRVERSAFSKHVLFPRKFKKDHPVCETLQQAGIQYIDDQINLPQNAQYEFFQMLVDEKPVSDTKLFSLYVNDPYHSYLKSLLGECCCFNHIDKRKRSFRSLVDKENLALIEKFLARGADIRYGHPTGGTILHFAQKIDHTALVKLVLDRGADPNVKMNDCCTALHTAVEKTDVETVKLLLKKKADVNAVMSNGVTPLHVAAEKGSLEIVKLLVAAGAGLGARRSDSSTPLHAAVKNKHVETVEHLLLHGANPNIRSNVAEGTPLHTACEMGLPRIAALLLAKGADVNLEHYDGRSALYFAVKRNSLEICELLARYSPDLSQVSNKKAFYHSLSSGAKYQKVTRCLLGCGFDVSVDDAANPDFLSGAVSQNLHGTVEKLLNFGANVNQCESWGAERTPIHKAAAFADEDMIQLVLNHGADVNGNSSDRTPLLVAIEHSNIKAAKALLANNASVREPPILLHSAARKCPEIVQLLLQYGADANAQDSWGQRPLHHAARYSNGDVIQQLLDHGANVNEASKNVTPLSEAVTYSNTETVRALLANGADCQYPPALLHEAVQTCPEIVELLLERVDVNSLNSVEQTPLSVAAVKGRPEVIDVLMKFGARGSFKDVASQYVKDVNSFQAFLDYGFIDLDLACDRYVQQFLGRYNSAESVEKMARHVIKVEAAYGSVESTVAIGLLEKFKLNDYRKTCEREIADMKNEAIRPSQVSFYDVLTKETHQVSCYVKNENIMRALTASNVNKKFPIYASVLECQIRKGTWRRQALTTGMRLLSSLSRQFFELPDELKERIVDYVSNQDILVLEKYLSAKASA